MNYPRGLIEAGDPDGSFHDWWRSCGRPGTWPSCGPTASSLRWCRPGELAAASREFTRQFHRADVVIRGELGPAAADLGGGRMKSHQRRLAAGRPADARTSLQAAAAALRTARAQRRPIERISTTFGLLPPCDAAYRRG